MPRPRGNKSESQRKRAVTGERGKRATTKRVAKRPAARPRAAAKDTATPARAVKRIDISPHRRRELIAQAAYFRAKARDFQGGNPLEDWLVAEAEVDRAVRAACRSKT